MHSSHLLRAKSTPDNSPPRQFSLVHHEDAFRITNGPGDEDSLPLTA